MRVGERGERGKRRLRRREQWRDGRAEMGGQRESTSFDAREEREGARDRSFSHCGRAQRCHMARSTAWRCEKRGRERCDRREKERWSIQLKSISSRGAPLSRSLCLKWLLLLLRFHSHYLLGLHCCCCSGGVGHDWRRERERENERKRKRKFLLERRSVQIGFPEEQDEAALRGKEGKRKTQTQSARPTSSSSTLLCRDSLAIRPVEPRARGACAFGG